MLLTEFMEDGSLLDYLRRTRPSPSESTFVCFFYIVLLPAFVGHSSLLILLQVSTRTLLQMSIDISSAMDHLERLGILHRDLAARNVLVRCGRDEDVCVKLSDFGLGRILDAYNKEYVMQQGVWSWVLCCVLTVVHPAKPLPTAWTAPEALTHMRFSSKSDVWSYAITVWEVCSLCLLLFGRSDPCIDLQ
jgi:serine/threonine protein kinase